ncbi:hypothetical protein [Oerskovia jenensis]|uniref:hypothetical protein n=1 Tax=Oerskovia jenensis TaxID=162169 RepID=UPI0036D9F1B5
MRLATILSESGRNVATGTSHAVGLALGLAIACGLLSGVDALTVIGLEQDATAYQASAAHVRTVSAPSAVDPDACAALTDSSSVQAAGALVPTEPLIPSATPANPLQAFSVTTSLGRVLGVDAPHPEGVWVSETLAQTLGLSVGGTLGTSDGPLVVAGTFPWPQDGRDSRLGLAVLVPTTVDQRYDECWAAGWPTTGAVDDLLRTVVDVEPQSTEAVTVGQVNTSLGKSFDAHQAFEERPTRFAPWGCAGVGFVLGYWGLRRRRLEHAGARHAGQSRSAQLATASLETAVWAGAGAVVGGSALLVLVTLSGAHDQAAVFRLAAQGVALGALGALLGATVAVSLVRERHLFRYFKDR